MRRTIHFSPRILQFFTSHIQAFAVAIVSVQCSIDRSSIFSSFLISSFIQITVFRSNHIERILSWFKLIVVTWFITVEPEVYGSSCVSSKECSLLDLHVLGCCIDQKQPPYLTRSTRRGWHSPQLSGLLDWTLASEYIFQKLEFTNIEYTIFETRGYPSCTHDLSAPILSHRALKIWTASTSLMHTQWQIATCNSLPNV